MADAPAPAPVDCPTTRLERGFIVLGVIFLLFLLVSVPLLLWLWRLSSSRARDRRGKRQHRHSLLAALDALTTAAGATTTTTTTDDQHRRCCTFVFTDIENSTLLSASDPEAFREIQETHDRLMRDALAALGGYEVNTEGDSFQCAFERAADAVLFCERVQRDLLRHDWSPAVLRLPGLAAIESFLQKQQQQNKTARGDGDGGGPGGGWWYCTPLPIWEDAAASSSSPSSSKFCWRGPRVRMGIHAGKVGSYRATRNALTGALQYSGPAFEMARKMEAAAGGGQILLTAAAVDRAREEGGLNGVFQMFHLGEYRLPGRSHSGRVVSVYQAMAVRGPLSYRSFPSLPLAQERPGLGFGLSQAPPGTAPICFVCLRIDGLASLSSLTRRKSVQLPHHLRKSFKSAKNKEKDVRHHRAHESEEKDIEDEEADFWNCLKPGLRQQLEVPLRSLIQSFGGYETLPKGSDVLCVVFSGAAREAVAARFCMALQTKLLLVNWSADVLAEPCMRAKYDRRRFQGESKRLLFRGPRIAAAIVGEAAHAYTVLKTMESPVHDAKDAAGMLVSPSVLDAEPSSEEDVFARSALDDDGDDDDDEKEEEEEDEEMGKVAPRFSKTLKQWKGTPLLLRMIAPVFLKRGANQGRARVGDSLLSFEAWSDSYPSTSCSSFCGTSISPSDFSGKKTLVLFFFFSNRTGGCVYEAKLFRDFHNFFSAAGAEVIGVSLDGESSQQSFSSSLRLPFPLISDYPGGLHACFEDFRLSTLVRRTYVVSKGGQLVSKFETNNVANTYNHVLFALEKAQALHQREAREIQVQYASPGLDLCAQVCRAAPGGSILYIQRTDQTDAQAMWSNLSTRGMGGRGLAVRPNIVDLGTHRLWAGREPASLFGLSHSVLEARWLDLRGRLRGGNFGDVLRPGAFDAPDPTEPVAIVFTFDSSGGSNNSSGRSFSDNGAEGEREGSLPPTCLDAALRQALDSLASQAQAQSQSLKKRQKMLNEAGKSFEAIARGHLADHRGYESQVVGANFMLAFATVEEAMSWAARTQADHYYSGTRSSRSRGIAMGICCGVPTYGKPHPTSGRQDYFGSVVNLAARIARAAGPGQILVDAHSCEGCLGGSSERDSLYAGRVGEKGWHLSVDIRVEAAGRRRFKGFAEERQVMQVVALRSGRADH